jgi:cytochrome d ubiquinol oxidase subunit II
MALTDLPLLWYLLVGILLAGYAVLDGFDLGVGALHLLARTDEQRRLFLNAIGPVWDGNEVWLVVGGGALFAAFPPVYATVFSGFYLALILLLFALIFRGVAIEFRSQQPGVVWRQTWDVAFSVASVVAALLMGVALGNVVRGIPLDAGGNYTGTFLDLLNPYALTVGVTTVTLFVMHAAIYLTLRTEGTTHDLVAGWVPPAILAFAVMYAATTFATIRLVPHMAAPFLAYPGLTVVPLFTLAMVLCVPLAIRRGRPGMAFLASCATILGLWALVGIGMFPRLVVASDPALSLTLHNASSSPGTLRTMTIIAAIGVPLVLAYTAGIYWVFRGKVRLDSMSY